MIKILAIFSILASLFYSQPIYAQDLEMPIGDFSDMRKTGSAKVSEVVNPLTIKLEDGRFIHLAGLNFPDLDFYDSGELSITAMAILDDFLKGQKVTIYQTKSAKKGRENRMGHHIAHLVHSGNDVWVQGLLLSLGVARTRTTQYNPEMGRQMLRLEDQAREKKSGMWNMAEFQVLTHDLAENHIGSYQIIEGRVHNASMRKNKLYLNFGNNWREDFTVAISSFNLRKFTKQKINPQSWNGKNIRVRGWLESYNGAYMELDHPERFEPLFEMHDNSTP